MLLLVNLPLTYTPISGPSSTEYLNLQGSPFAGWTISKFLVTPFNVSTLIIEPPIPVIVPVPKLIRPLPVSMVAPFIFRLPEAISIVGVPKSITVPSSVILELPIVEALVNLTIVLLVPLTDTAVPCIP